MGAGWGATQPLAKIAVSEGYRSFGIIFWQMVVGVVVLGAILILRGGFPTFRRPQIIFCTYIALIGTLLPNAISYETAIHLPAGVLSIIIAAVPIFAFPIALAIGLDRFSWVRLFGLVAGLFGVALLVAPDSLPGLSAWVLIGLISPAMYAIEGNSVAKLGTFGLDPVGVLFGASLIGSFLAFPIAIASGTWVDPLHPWNGPDYAVLASSVLHAFVYASYVWMVGRAGPVFAGQVSYLVTGFGVVWSMVFLGETYGAVIWLALAIMGIGLFLVQPRTTADLAPAS